jgi:hypothetical protein
METSINGRLKQWIGEVNMTTNAFANSIKKSFTAVDSVVKGKTKPGFDMLEAIFEQYPDLNPEWLMLGQGEMKRGTASVPSERGGEALEAELRERINLQTAMISDLRYTVELQKRLLEGKKPEGAIERPLWPEECIEIGASAMLA